MKAVAFTAYGPPEVLKLIDTPIPAVSGDQMRVRVACSTVAQSDCEIRAFRQPSYLWPLLRLVTGVFRPRQNSLGLEFSGVVDAVGERVDRFRPGDAVCGSLGLGGPGAYAEFLRVRQESPLGKIVLKPVDVPFAEAAALPMGGLTALRYIRRAAVQPGERVLIIGAGGSIGSFAVQLAHHAGGVITAVDSAEKAALLRELGADHVVDYRAEDITQSGETFDVLFDVVGALPFAAGLALLKPGGRYLMADPAFWPLVRGWLRLTAGRRVYGIVTDETEADLQALISQVQSGDLRVVIDREYPLDDIVAAHAYVDSGRKQGNVVVRVWTP